MSTPHAHYSMSLTSPIEPKSYAEANTFECSNQATQLELIALQEHGSL